MRDFSKSLTLEATSFSKISNSPGLIKSEILSLALNLVPEFLILSLIISEISLLVIWSSKILILSLGNVEVLKF